MSHEVENGRASVPRVSYAQNGEDILLDRVFGDRVGTFVDVGACHPVYHNNTYFFYERGWRGVNVEPIPWARGEFERLRPDDLNLSVACGEAEGELPFFELPSSGGLSTLSAEIADEYRAKGLDVVERRVPVRTVAALVDEHAIAPPDLLSIDAEGTEAQVVRGLPLDRWRPRVVVVESTWPQTTIPSHEEWEPVLLAHGYLFAAFNGVNRFYLRDDLRDHLGRLATPVSVLDDFVPYDVRKLEVALREREALHRRDQGEFEAQRAEFVAAYAEFERQRAEFERAYAEMQRQAREFEQLHAEFEETTRRHALEREEWGRQAEALTLNLANWERRGEALEWRCSDLEIRLGERERELAASRHECAAYRAQLAEHQQLLRPYRLIDRYGVVNAGYRMARKLKRDRAG